MNSMVIRINKNVIYFILERIEKGGKGSNHFRQLIVKVIILIVNHYKETIVHKTHSHGQMLEITVNTSVIVKW